MLSALLRVLFGFAVACLAAAAVQVTYAFAPAEDTPGPTGLFELLLLTATHLAVFSAPFTLVAAAVGEWQSIRSWLYYAAAGVGVALAGFLAQYSSESGGPTILNDYALKAFLTPGFFGGLAYWLVAGRRAGDGGSAEDVRTSAMSATRQLPEKSKAEKPAEARPPPAARPPAAAGDADTPKAPAKTPAEVPSSAMADMKPGAA